MSTAREKLFVCTFTSRSRRLASRVRAWDERQAAQAFLEELSESGVTERGRVEVVEPTRPPLQRLDVQVVAR